MSILEQFTDEDLLGLVHYGLTKTQVYKLRKGTLAMADISPNLERDLTERLEAKTAEDNRPDPENPDFTHPGFQRYEVSFRDDAKKHGLIPAYERWTAAIGCGCMGPQGDMPFCPCQMRVMTANRFAKVVPTEEGEALL